MNKSSAYFILGVFFAFIFLVSSAPSYAQSTASISGSVADESGAPIAGASIAMRGPATLSTTSDAKGAFSFTSATPGVYVLTVTKPGYTTAVQNDIIVLAGQSSTLAVRMGAATFSSLRTIASVRTTGRGIDTAASSVNVVSTQTFIDQAQPQVTRVLSQVPGLQISFPSNSANAASPGAITIPNIRAATAYETASLIDGHPISVGQYGDNVTTFLNSFMFGNVEVIKGPGADAPEVNNAIGGTTNFRTKDPTLTPTAHYLAGVDNRGGTLTNFDFSNTLGKLGFVLDFATNNNPSALEGKTVYYDPTGGLLNGNTLNGDSTRSNVGNTASQITTGFPLLACCYTLHGNFDQTAELFKLRYRFTPQTALTLSYLGAQSWSDQNGNTSAFTDAQFAPTDPAYNGPLPPGNIQVANVFPGAYNGEFNNEPILQAEFSTTLNRDVLLARYYHATISRFQFQGSQDRPDFNTATLYGVSSGPGNINATFNGTPANIGFNDLYQEPELDKLSGATFELQHPVGTNDLLTFSAERTWSQSTDYSLFAGPFYSFGLPPGTSQMLTTYMARGHFYFGSKWDATLSTYFNTYSSTFPVGCPLDTTQTPPVPNCNTLDAAVYGNGVTFATTKNSHVDPRLGLVFRPNVNSSLRFALGSSIAPPFLGLLNQITSTPAYDPTTGVAIEQQSNGNLRPETGFGYDLGGDVRLKDQTTIFSGDVYLTNLYNRFFAQTVNTGLTCSATNVCDGNGVTVPAGTPILNQTNANISNARFEGVELNLRREPAVGFGFQLAAALQKGYYYNLPPNFYCSIPVAPCTPDQNLNIISGQNTNGVPVGFYSVSYNGNMRLPYSQGNAEFSYTFKNGAYVALGDTYYGHNNSLNRPAFGIAYATFRHPLGSNLSLQLSGDNIFNAYPGILPIYGGGVPIDLFGGQTAATSGNVLGPATWRLILSTRLH